MAPRPKVPYDLLASQYIRAVMDGRPPGAVCRHKFKMTVRQWQERRTNLSRTGWLPPGDPVRDGRLCGAYDEAWVETALAMVSARLSERAAVVRARQARMVELSELHVYEAERREARGRVERRRQDALHEESMRRAQAGVQELFL